MCENGHIMRIMSSNTPIASAVGVGSIGAAYFGVTGAVAGAILGFAVGFWSESQRLNQRKHSTKHKTHA